MCVHMKDMIRSRCLELPYSHVILACTPEFSCCFEQVSSWLFVHSPFLGILKPRTKCLPSLCLATKVPLAEEDPSVL